MAPLQCEKPACSHATELAAVIAAAEASGKAFMEAMRPLKTPNFDAVKSTLAELGPARHFSGTFCQYVPAPTLAACHIGARQLVKRVPFGMN